MESTETFTTVVCVVSELHDDDECEGSCINVGIPLFCVNFLHWRVVGFIVDLHFNGLVLKDKD